MANKTYLKTSLNWDKLIEEYRTSGKAADKWCVEHSIKVNQLRYQISKRSKSKKEIKSTSISFLPVEVIPEPAQNTENKNAILLKLGKIELCITENFNPDLLIAVVKTLQPLC